MFGDWGRSLAWQRLAQFQFRKRQARITRNLRGTRRMPRGQKRRKGTGPIADPGYRKFKVIRRRGRGPAIKRRFLRLLP